MKDRSRLLARIYRLKLILAGAVLVILGLLTSVLGNWLDSQNVPHLLVALANSLADVFLVAGAIGIAVDFFTGKDCDAADTEHLRNLLREAAPEFRDAVIAGFANTPENMRGVATTETLDKLATNALALRLGDAKFAKEIYTGLLAQAIRTPERWHDVNITIKLSCIQEKHTEGVLLSSVRGLASRKVDNPLFAVVVTWEYTLVPSARVRRFVATNDLDEFRELLDDVPATCAWFITPATADASHREAFEVLSYSVDGEEKTVRRSARRTGQTYSVDLGPEVIVKNEPVRIRQVYRTIIRQSGHRFRVALAQPTRGLRVTLDYTGTDIAELKVGDLISSASAPEVTFLPKEAPAKQVQVTVPGWLLPQAEVTFVWTLASELPTPSAHRKGEVGAVANAA
jgi:hypothetical protein